MPDDEDYEENVVYISRKYGVSIHKCLCGCGLKTVLPFYENDDADAFDKKHGWRMIEKDDKITFKPSILNPPPCKSHYIITKNIANFV